jgi:hypothetical protein
MLKFINITLLISIIGTVVYYTNYSEPDAVVVVEDAPVETPDPGSAGDEYQVLEKVLGSEKASTE